jgi:hypothetical protein
LLFPKVYISSETLAVKAIFTLTYLQADILYTQIKVQNYLMIGVLFAQNLWSLGATVRITDSTDFAL